MDRYLNEAELNSGMQALANAYPSYCELFDLPHRTHEQRTVRALRIGSKSASDILGRPKIGILFTGSTHAREWGGADILIYLASDLLKAYAAEKGLHYSVSGKGPGITFTAAQIQKLRDHVILVLVPCVNPDGRAHSMSSAQAHLWRKNRNPGSGQRPDRIGVDINRNFDFLWDHRKAFAPGVSTTGMSSDDPESDTFWGTAPNSEPETKNIVYLLENEPQLRYFIDIHSCTGDILHPWGDAPNQSTNPAQNFLNSFYDGKRGVDDLSVYGEYIRDGEEATALRLAASIPAAIKRVSGETYEVTQSFYLAPGVAGGAPGQTFPTGGVADDYATSRSRSVSGAQPILGFTLEFHRYPHTDSYGFHPPFPKMASIIAEVDAGLIAFCLGAQQLHDIPPKVPELYGEVLFGVTVDGGGIIIINGKPHPVPPWEALIPALSNALRVYFYAEQLPAEYIREAQNAALKAMANAIETALKRR